VAYKSQYHQTVGGAKRGLVKPPLDPSPKCVIIHGSE